jgi:hypothetical protein
VLLWIVYPLLAIRHKRLVKIIDEGTITPSDFTLEFSHLPKDLDVEEFKEWAEQNSVENKIIQIAKVNLAYDIDDYVRMRRRYVYWRQRLETSTEHRR